MRHTTAHTRPTLPPPRVPYEAAIGVHDELVKRYKETMGRKAKDIGDPKVMNRASTTRIDDEMNRPVIRVGDTSTCGATLGAKQDHYLIR